jgi:hypothetical protein
MSSITRRVAIVAVLSTLAALRMSASAFAVGTFQASIVRCTTPPDGGDVQGTVRVTIGGVPGGSQVFLLVGTPLQTSPPQFVSVGFADANGSLIHELTMTERNSPIGISAQLNPGNKIDPGIIGSGHISVTWGCPAVKPTDALQAAVDSGTLTATEAAPVRLALRAAVALEAAGHPGAAIVSLRVGRLAVNGLVRFGKLTAAEAAPIIAAINSEITRPGGTP